MSNNYPTGTSWTAKENKEYKIVGYGIIRVVINELSDSYMENKIEGDIVWANIHILTKNNQYRVAIKHVRAKSFFWQKQSIGCHVAKKHRQKIHSR